ncbi:MAG TPA: peptidoglycan DD-metalloendopeptidase family protein [Sphingomicrobium sp.]
MMRAIPLLLAPLLLAASGPAAPEGETLDSALQRARAEQASAENETRRLEQIASRARSEAARLGAEQAAAAQAIAAAEARITAADANLRLVSARAEMRRNQLQREQQPIASLLSGLVVMAQRPPLLAVADRGGTDELVKVRVLLDSTLPVIRSRTAALSSQLAASRRLEAAAIAARTELTSSRQQLVDRRTKFAALEERAVQASASAQGQALASGDVALSAGESFESLKSAQAGNRAARAIAAELAASDPAPPRPSAPESGSVKPPMAYVLAAKAPVAEGLGSVNANGVRARGLTLATGRGSAVVVPASGMVRFSGPFRSHDGVVIIDHGRGWMSLIVNVGSELKPGDRVTIGRPLGRALGPIEVELSQNGRRVSPALIAGSSQTLSNVSQGG